MKRFFALVLVLLVLLLFSGCESKADKPDKINVVTTVFPIYDFVKNIAGDKVEATLLLKTGAEAHSYEPTVQDIVKIQECDLFLYLGSSAEAWAEGVVKDKVEKGSSFSLMDALSLKGEEHHHEGESHYQYDEHIWTSLRNSEKIVNIIARELGKADSENSVYYLENASKYIEKLRELDKKFTELTKNTQKPLIFADKFPFRYFTEDYALSYMAAYPGCSSESEPSVATVSQLIDEIRKNNIGVVFYTETSNRQLPDAVAEETGAKKLLLHSCHTLTDEEIKAGLDYLSVMNNNYNALSEYIKN